MGEIDLSSTFRENDSFNGAWNLASFGKFAFCDRSVEDFETILRFKQGAQRGRKHSETGDVEEQGTQRNRGHRGTGNTEEQGTQRNREHRGTGNIEEQGT